jgi:integrase
VHRQLSTVETLRRGRPLPCGTVPAETDPVRPVPEELVHAIRPFLSPQVEAIVLLQLHTGARGGELLGLRPRDIAVDERTGIWFCELDEHKTAHHGKRRTLVFGPQSQAVLEPFMRNRDADAYLFSPREAEEARRRKATAARRTPLDRGNRVGTNRKPESPRVLGDRYDSSVHGQATAGRSRERAGRRSRRRRTSSPRARPRCERGARPTLSWANTASTPASPHRGHADPTGVRT